MNSGDREKLLSNQPAQIDNPQQPATSLQASSEKNSRDSGSTNENSLGAKAMQQRGNSGAQRQGGRRASAMSQGSKGPGGPPGKEKKYYHVFVIFHESMLESRICN